MNLEDRMDNASHGDSAFVFETSEANFNAEVVHRSMETPVLVDFWAPWCAPCRSLGPILEKLAAEYRGAFVLAKINADEAPQLSRLLQIRSIPFCVLFVGGRPVDTFQGALPEGQLRAFLDRSLVSEGEQLRRAAAEAEGAEKEQLLREAQSIEPSNPAILADLGNVLFEQGHLDDVEALLSIIPAADHTDALKALAGRMQLARQPKPPGDVDELEARIAQNAKDFEARFALADLWVYGGDYSSAFDQLLEVVLRDRGEGAGAERERARLKLIEWFGVCPDAKAVAQGRRMLGMYLN